MVILYVIIRACNLQIPDMLGVVLSSSKYGVRQARGKYGMGAKMALIWSKKSTGLPIQVRHDQCRIVRNDGKGHVEREKMRERTSARYATIVTERHTLSVLHRHSQMARFGSPS